tara:strand:- start:92 stop:1282 length:1191 start_codon:yes stop_codon:yes gene_type:complete
MGTFFIATFVLGKNLSGNKYENQMFNNINDEIEETYYDNRNPNSNNNRDYTDTLLYDLNWIESDLMNPGDVMVTAFQMEASGILKGVNVPVYDWGDTEGELTVSIHNLSYPYGSDGVMYDQSLVNSSGWLAGYDDDGTGAINLEGEIWNSDAGTCGGGTMIGNATDPLGSEYAEDGGPAGVPSMGLVWPDGFTAYTLNPTNNPGIVGGGGDNWRSLEPYGSEPEVSLGDWIGVVVQNTGTGSVQFQYSDGGNESDPWKSITFYGTDCQGIGGETGWYIQSYIFNYQLAIELSAPLGSVDEYAIPEQFSLYQNYPNPFNPVTTLRYDLPEDAMVNVTIYDMMGRVVKTMINSQQNAGFKSVQWDATNNEGQTVAAGLYLYTIGAGEFRQTKKMVLLK